MSAAVRLAPLALAAVLFTCPVAGADAGTPGAGIGGEPGLGANGVGGSGLSPASAAIFLCPGRGGAMEFAAIGGGYCDFNFTPVMLSATTFGVMHVHCEWVGLTIVVEGWNCWRVFPGQPDHPALPDPDIIPDGYGVPWAIQGPSPNNQWPPPGLAPGQQLLAPGPPGPPPPGGAPPPPAPGFVPGAPVAGVPGPAPPGPQAPGAPLPPLEGTPGPNEGPRDGLGGDRGDRWAAPDAPPPLPPAPPPPPPWVLPPPPAPPESPVAMAPPIPPGEPPANP
jgi:hypothetical protein